MTGLARTAMILAAGLAAMAGWSAVMVSKGVVKEQARVEVVGKEIAKRALASRAKAEAKPHETLKSYCRDC